ncbi:AAA family ATPase [Rhizobium sp. BK251]|uniref:ATP-binding protein n=1 Tax=Rhizobium sp. BK251 TaxID=2512125 RepID=UPI00104F65C6|nr:AAA family ATPase [Rhizobium sp. BK251]TCL74573.1 adenylate/guanylate cyclase family protein [Rhizobium sp. BK251]
MPGEDWVNKPRQSKRRPRGSGRSSTLAGERQIVTALCYDLVGSTNLFHSLDIEDYQELIDTFQQAAKQSVSMHSGLMRVEAGDGGVALFPVELGARDAATLAIQAGFAIIEACKRIGQETRHDLHVRIGIATSVALVQERSEKDASSEPVAGAALAMATRLEAVAAPDSILVSQQTRNLAGRSHAFAFEGVRTLKGFAEPERVWRALGHRKKVGRFYAFGRLGGPFIGRRHELETIADVWKDTLSGRGQVLAIEGDAGIGKSRLLREIRRMTRESCAGSFLFQCLPGSSRSTLHPMVNGFPGVLQAGKQLPLTASTVTSTFRRHGIVDEEIIEIFAYLLGATGRNENLSRSDPKTIKEKAYLALSRILETVCKRGPVVLAVEDIHWIDPTSRDLLAETARVVRRLPVLLVVTTRRGVPTEWLEDAAPTRMALQPLDQEETKLAIEAKWPEHRRAVLPDFLEASERVSGGVPLFIEEICQWAAENAGADAMSVSSTVPRTHVSAFEGILDARLAQLGPIREVARAASIAGSRFTLPLLRELLPDLSRKFLVNAAETLCETGFLTRLRASGPPAYGFRHALIQETIYNALLRKQRQLLHRRLFNAVSAKREIARWIDTGVLAEHAERCGQVENAVHLLMQAQEESAGRSAMIEARHHVEHALALCDSMQEGTTADVLRLSAISALGPILTGTVGLNSPAARQLYEEGMAIARRQPREDQPRWFPIYWGWWLTGEDFLVMHDRALQVQAILAEVDDPEIQLQVNHCIWAIDFDLGWHKETQAAIVSGLALYDEQSAKTARTLYGGHDAKVCGLGQFALSLWMTGQTKASDEALAEMIAFVDRIAHIPSKAHSLDTEAVSAFYRDDYVQLAEVSARMMEFSRKYEMQSLAGLSLLFGGWATAHRGNLGRGHDMFREGLSLLRRLGAVADLPLYLCMQATILGLEGSHSVAVQVATDAISEAKQTGHAYWLAELYRCRAVLRAKGNAPRDLVVADFQEAITIARGQGATALLERAVHSIEELKVAIKI